MIPASCAKNSEIKREKLVPRGCGERRRVGKCKLKIEEPLAKLVVEESLKNRPSKKLRFLISDCRVISAILSFARGSENCKYLIYDSLSVKTTRLLKNLHYSFFNFQFAISYSRL